MTYLPPPPPAGPYRPAHPGVGRRKSKLPWILVGVAAVVLLCCGGVTAVGLLADPPPETSDTADAAPQEAVEASTPARTTQDAPDSVKPAQKPADAAGPGVGDPARDGKFEFVVQTVTCGKASVGSGFLVQEAQGTFCLIKVQVKNIGDEARTFTGANQKAFAGKVEYSNDTGAELAANEQAATFLEEINPGNSVAATLVFDVPKGTKLTAIELHDSAFSGGVTVTLN